MLKSYVFRVFGSSLSNANASFLGECTESYTGVSTSEGGDLNNDGYDDFIIGGLGEVYVIFGSPDYEWRMDIPLSMANASFIGGSDFGRRIGSAGDVNDDGFDDFFIGSDLFNGGAGKVYLIFGGSNGRWIQDSPLSSANASFTGEFPNDWSGRSVSTAGDVNQDGYDDFLIGAPRNDESGDNAGKVYLFHGSSSENWTFNSTIGKANKVFFGKSANERLGQMVDSAGDFNGDGNLDILVGAPNNDVGASQAGATYLILRTDIILTETVVETEIETITNTHESVETITRVEIITVSTDSTITEYTTTTAYITGSTDMITEEKEITVKETITETGSVNFQITFIIASFSLLTYSKRKKSD